MFAKRLLQTTTANIDQIREIERRVRSLDGVLTRPVGDQDSEEKARREALREFVLPPSSDVGALLTLFHKGVGRNCGEAQNT